MKKLNSSPLTANESPIVPATMGGMLSDESYTLLCEAVERVNDTVIQFFPEYHFNETSNIKGALYYNLSGRVVSGNNSIHACGNYMIDYTCTDTIESVADRIGKQIAECEAQALDDLRDGTEMRDTLDTLNYLYNHSR